METGERDGSMVQRFDATTDVNTRYYHITYAGGAA